MKIKFLTFVLTFLFVNILFAEINYSPNQNFRVYAVNPSDVSIDIFFEAVPSSGTVNSVYAIIDGTNYQANFVSGNKYVVSFSTNTFGVFPLKGFMTTSTGNTDSTFLTNIKIIQLSTCPIADWSSSIAYNGGDYVSYNDTLYVANYWTQGSTPGVSYDWTPQGICSSQNYPVLDCSNVPTWVDTLIYGPSNNNIDVEYNGIVYHANYWTQNNVPDQFGPWSFVAVCATLNKLPVIQSSFVDSVIIQANISSLAITANITDIDGQISNVEFIIDNNIISPVNVSANNYTVNWTPPSYGIFPISIIAVDDELGTDTLTGTIQIANSVPPVISMVYPEDNQNISNIYNLNSDSILLSAKAIDPDGTIADVTFRIDGQTFQYSTQNNNTYSYNWAPSTYGVHSYTVEATDNSGTVSQMQLSFNIINPFFETIDTTNIPLQIQANLGYNKVFDFGEQITGVLVRNTDLLKATFSGSQLTINSNRPGRTGLKITTNTNTYYIGIRINYCDGSIPGLPDYASIGFKSQDIVSDLEFWEDMDTGMTNKNMDVRYIYINGGPAVSGIYNSWRDSTRTINYCINSLKYGLIPVFVYYNIPDGGESFATDLAHAQDTAYMKEYFQDLNNFIDHCTSVLGDELFGIVLEPDFLGYMQQLGAINLGTNNPDSIPTCVSNSSIATNAGTIHTLVDRINKTIDDKRNAGANLFYGWELNLWSAGLNGSLGLMRRTDTTDLGWVAGRATIAQAATSTVTYGMNSGILSHNADFISIDKYGLDAEGYSSAGVTSNPWWFNHDHWDNYMMYAKTMHQVSGADIVLWQLPVGRINGSLYQSAYTGSTYNDLPNTAGKYEDSSLDYFFGDTFVEDDSIRFYHFTQNYAQDTTLSFSADTISWNEHISKFNECGIIHAMFGAGVGWSTDGIGNPPSDEYFSIQKIQDYYRKNLSFLPTAPFTSSVLIFNASSSSEDLTVNYPYATNFVGYACTENGVFNPSMAGLGIHYVTFIVDNGNCKEYKVQKIIVTSNCYVTSTISEDICNGDTYIFGTQNLTNTGSYTQILTASTGCDSIVTLNLNVTNIDNSVTKDGNMLTANFDSADYQWLDCDNDFSEIPGAVNQSFTAQNSGNYAVEITFNNCVDTSACQSVIVQMLNDKERNSYSIYPNPTSGNIHIDLAGKYKNVSVTLRDIYGRTISNSKYDTVSKIDFEINKPKGLYFLEIAIGNSEKTIFKVIKK